MSGHSKPLPFRFVQYLFERLPPQSHGLLIVVFTFSAIAYSLLLRGETSFIAPAHFALACYITFTTFLLLRISDEFKDAEEDALHRPTLPVPRGLITLRELGGFGILILLSQVILLTSFAASVLPLYGIALGYMALMFWEFGVPTWLKRNQWAYNGSHMFIIPLVDIVASSFDWSLAGADAPFGLVYFFAVSYCNGIVLELGRKFGPPEEDDPGNRLYTTMLGPNRAILTLLTALVATLALAFLAAQAAGHPTWVYLAFSALVALVGLTLYRFKTSPSGKTAKHLEISTGLWSLGMYLLLGGILMLGKLLGA